MTNLNELNSLTETIKNLDRQIDGTDRNPIKEDIYKTYTKGIAIIHDCRKFIGDNLGIFVNSPIIKKNTLSGCDNQYWFVGGLTFIVKENGEVVRCWKMRKSSNREQGYYDHETPYGVDWYSYDSIAEYPNVNDVDDNKLLSVKNDVDYFYSECESLYGLIADALTKTKEYKEKHLNRLNSALDNGSMKKEVIYRIEITRETEK